MKRHIILFLGITVFITFSCKGPEGPAGYSGNNSIESLTDPSVQPRVIYTNPPANSVGPYADFNYTIMLRFNKIMDHNSIRRNVKLYSSIGNIFADTNNFRTTGGDVYTFNAVDSIGRSYGNRWNIGQVCSLKVLSGAKDINGNLIMQRYNMTFLPEPYFRVRNIYPLNGSTNISVSHPISLYFNSTADSSIFSSIKISPDVGGYWSISPYSDSTQITFTPTDLFYPGTTYNIFIDTTAHDKHRNHLLQQFQSTFHTIEFKVNSTSPINGSTNVSFSSNIVMNFTAPIDTGTVRSAFEISPNISGYFYMDRGSSSFQFVHDDLIADTIYTVTIDTSIRAMNGDKLLNPFQFSFGTTIFRVVTTSPYDGEILSSRYLSGITVVFNGAIDTSTIRTAFDLPGVTGNYSVYFYDGSSYLYFDITNTPLAANTTYTATISTSLKARNGASLKAPYSFSFTTGN